MSARDFAGNHTSSHGPAAQNCVPQDLEAATRSAPDLGGFPNVAPAPNRVVRAATPRYFGKDDPMLRFVFIRAFLGAAALALAMVGMAMARGASPHFPSVAKPAAAACNAFTSPLVGEVGVRSTPGEGMASKTPPVSFSPSPPPLPHQGEGLEERTIKRGGLKSAPSRGGGA
jgi:hypothetical protein